MESLSSRTKQVVMSKKRGFWKPEEDLILRNYVQTHGEGHWASISEKSGLKRGGKSCRLRWKNYLRPNIKRGSMSQEEEDLIIRMHKLLGNRWSLIAGRLPGRTDNEVKNYWNTHLNKRVSSPPAKRKTNMDDQEDNKASFAVNKRVRTLCSEGDDDDGNVSVIRKEESAVTAPSRDHPGGWIEDLMSFSYGEIESSLQVKQNYAAAAAAAIGFEEEDFADFMPYLDYFLLFGALE